MNSSITIKNNGYTQASPQKENDCSINFENIAKLNIGGDISPKTIKNTQPKNTLKKINILQSKEKQELKNGKVDYKQLDSVFNAFLKSSKKSNQNKNHYNDIIDIKQFLITNPLSINNKPELMQTKSFLGSKTKRTKKFIISSKNDVPNQTLNSLKNTINFGSTTATFKPSLEKSISIIRIQKDDEENQDINNCNTQISSNNPGTDMINHKVFFKIL